MSEFSESESADVGAVGGETKGRKDGRRIVSSELHRELLDAFRRICRGEAE